LLIRITKKSLLENVKKRAESSNLNLSLFKTFLLRGSLLFSCDFAKKGEYQLICLMFFSNEESHIRIASLSELLR